MLTRAERVAIGCGVFIAGATLMALEVAGFRIIGRHFGTAIRETTVVIAVFLTAMSVGYWAGGRAADRFPRLELLLLVMLGGGASMLLIPVAEQRVTEWIGDGELPLTTHAFIATVVLFTLPTFLLASTTPVAVRLLSSGIGRSGSVAGTMSALSTVGSILGSVAAAFFLLDWLQSIKRTVVVLAVSTLATAVLIASVRPASRLYARAAIGSPPSPRRRFLQTAIPLVAAGLILNLVAAIKSAPADLSEFHERNARNRLLFERDSPYHHIVVREHDRKKRFLQFDHTVQSSMPTNDPAGPGLEYTNYFHIGKLLRPSARRVLFIGLGGGTGPKQFLAFYPDVIIDVVEVDPVVIDVAKEFFGVRAGPRLRLHVGDGRVFVDRSSDRYDLIIIDAYTVNRYGATIPPHLCTREFFDLLSKRLTEDGLMHFHCAAPVLNPLSRALFKTLHEVFPHIAVFGGTELIASAAPLPSERERLVAAAEEMTQRGTLPIPGMAARMKTLRETRPPTLDVPVLTDDHAPVDRLYRMK